VDNTASKKCPSWLVGRYSGRHAYVSKRDYSGPNILSLLHIEIGVGNQLLKMLLDWIDMRLEI
jgi:hypothetical protein